MGTEAIEFSGSFAPLSQAYLQLTGGTLTGPLTVNAHLQFGAQIPVAVAGGNAGGGPPSPVVTTGSNDGAGNITFGTGTSPGAGTMVQVTFAQAWSIPGGGAPHIILTAANSALAALTAYVSGASPAGFGISVVTAPAASQANTTYSVNYVVMG